MKYTCACVQHEYLAKKIIKKNKITECFIEDIFCERYLLDTHIEVRHNAIM